MPTTCLIKVPVTGDKKMENMVSDLEDLTSLVGKTYLPYNLIDTVMKVQPKQNTLVKREGCK